VAAAIAGKSELMVKPDQVRRVKCRVTDACFEAAEAGIAVAFDE
jgi:hypothetical protein